MDEIHPDQVASNAVGSQHYVPGVAGKVIRTETRGSRIMQLSEVLIAREPPATKTFFIHFDVKGVALAVLQFDPDHIALTKAVHGRSQRQVSQFKRNVSFHKSFA